MPSSENTKRNKGLARRTMKVIGKNKTAYCQVRMRWLTKLRPDDCYPSFPVFDSG